jgi:hypothetical protein
MRKITQMLLEAANVYLKDQFKDDAVGLNKQIQVVTEAFEVVDRWMASPYSRSHNPQVVMEAMGIANFNTYLSNIISRRFYDAYATARGAWADYTTPDTTNDFRQVERGRTSDFGELYERNSQGEFERDEVDQTFIYMKVREFGRTFGLEWKVLINDDLGEIRNFVTKMINAATYFEDKFVHRLYGQAAQKTAMTGLGAAYSGTQALTVAGVMSAYESYMTRTKDNGDLLNVPPAYLVHHPAKALVVQELLAGLDLATGETNRATRGLLLPRPDPYLTTTAEWWLFCDPSSVAAVPVLRMTDFDKPAIYQKAPNSLPISPNGSVGSPSMVLGDFHTGNLEFMVQDIIGGRRHSTWEGIGDPKGLFYSAGTG